MANQRNITLVKKTLANNLLWRSSRNEWWPSGNVGGVKLWRIELQFAKFANVFHRQRFALYGIIVTDEINVSDDNATNVATPGAPTGTYIKQNDAVITNFGSEASTGMYTSNDGNTATSQTATGMDKPDADITSKDKLETPAEMDKTDADHCDQQSKIIGTYYHDEY